VRRRQRGAPGELRELRQATASRQRRRTASAGAIRRRRRTALGVIVGLVAIVGGGTIALSSDSGGSKPRYNPGAIGVASTITPALPPANTTAADHAPPFHPSHAALKLASSMSLAQQVAQLFLVSIDGTGQAATATLGTTPWGGFVFDNSNEAAGGPLQTLVTEVVAAEKNLGSIPPLMAAAQAGGFGTAFRALPPAAEQAVGETGKPSVAQEQALAAGKALKQLGFELTIAPWVDVDTPAGALTGDLYSTSPSVVARFALAALSGYAQAGVLAAPAHFPGEGGASTDPDQMTATVGGSLAALRGRDLIPFAAVVPHAPVIVMSNAEYAAFDGVTPAGLLPAAVELLRNSLGFGGVVMSDDLDATLDATGESPAEVAVQALRAGDDLLYITGPASEHAAAYHAVLAAASASAADRARVRTALLRDLMLKARVGLLPPAR
jgi:beta-N-acetylhexosaminidase